jgi:hypothetical protein
MDVGEKLGVGVILVVVVIWTYLIWNVVSGVW